MTKVIIVGHGGYGSAMKRNLNMLTGEQPDYSFIDFNEQDEIVDLQRKLQEALAQIGDSPVLFCCDLAGGSPFREAASLCLTHPGYCCCAGLNTVAYAEMSFNLELEPVALAAMACEVAKQSIQQFPEPQG